MDCLFCKIVAGQIPCTKLYENDTVLAFADINPVNAGHALVIPKEHFESCASTTDGAMADVMAVVKRVGDAALKATGAGGYNVNINCGEVAGQVIMHTHVHVIPRHANDGLKLWPKGDVSDEAKAAAAEEMRKLLA